MNPLKTLTHLVILLLIVGISGGTFSCKSKKKLAAQEAAAAEARKIAKAKADLEELLSSSSTLSLEEKEEKLQYIKDLNIEDPEVKELIAQVEDKLKREREALLAKENAERLAKEREERLKAQGTSETLTLNDHFDNIAGADNLATANRMIEEALQLFASDNTPVLIIINQSGGVKDYDRPTTIRKYLNYCKDQKVSRNEVENVVYDSNGKITELELIRK